MSKREGVIAAEVQAPKWETIRRLRYGDLIRLFRYRWGHVLPEDDSGWGDLWLLVTNVSLAAAEPEKKMRHVIEMWAPWMPPDDREMYVRHVWGLDIYQRTQTGEEIGRLLGLTNAERQGLKLWRFLPIDATREEIEEQRKARRSENRRAKSRAKGVRPREAYVAASLNKQRPWEAEGISRRTWERRRVASHVPTIVSKGSTVIATRSGGESEKGPRKSGGVEKPGKVLRLGVAERKEQSGSSELVTDLRHSPREDAARVRSEIVERSHEAWLEKISGSRKGADVDG
jgi:hypothetical protein